MQLQLQNDKFPSKALQESAVRIFESAHLCSIATITSSSHAHINTAFFCYDKFLEIFFLSETDSIHAQNLLSNSSIALSIFDTHQPWGEPLLGMQVFGECKIASIEDHIRAAALYRSRFPVYVKHLNGFLLKYRFFKVKPHTLKIVDEIQFPDDEHVIAEVNYT